MKQFYMVMGDFDFIGICEAPDDAVMARYVLQLGGLGFVRTKTLKASPETAYREIIRVGLNLKADRSRVFDPSLSLRPLPRPGASRRPLPASSVVGATDDCRSTVWVLLLRALA